MLSLPTLPAPADRGHRPRPSRNGLAAVTIAAMLLATLVWVAPVAAAGTRYYVDGKTGNDSRAGTSLSTAFRTLEHALGLQDVRDGGATISIVGYEGFTYYESLSRPYSMFGSASSPVIIEGYRPASGTFVRPTISGAKIVSKPGSTAWKREAGYPNVWRIPWTTPILGYESSRRSSRFDVVFMDGTHQLRRPSDKPSLATLQATPGSQYWDGRYLRVHLGVWGGGSVDKDPNKHLISVPHHMGIAVNNDSSYVTLRDLRIIHTAGAISFYAGTHHGTVQDVELSYNFVLGLYSEGDDMSFSGVSGKRNGLQLIKLDRGAVRNVVSKAYAVEHPGQGIKISGPTTGYNTVEYSTFTNGVGVPKWVASYGGETQGIDIEQGTHHNMIRSNTIRGMGRGLMLYQYDSSGKALTGNRIERNYFDSNYRGVVLWDGKSGADGSGAVTFYRNTYRHNGNAIYAPTPTKNKTFKNETIYDTVGGSGTGYHSAIYLLGSGTRITLQNVIFNKGKGYAVYAGSGASATATYSHASGMTLGRSKGSVSWSTGSSSKAPSFLSTNPSSTSFLTIDSGSPLYRAGSSGTPAGARWK